MSIRLIAVDIDGTLVNSHGELPDANRAAIHDALADGLEIVLVTGRAFHHALPVAEALSDDLLLVVNNGALVKLRDGTTVDRRLLTRELAAEVLSGANPLREGAALIFDRLDSRQYVYERIEWQHPNRRAYYERNHSFMTELSPLEEALTEDPAQVAFTGSVVEMRRLAEHLRGQPVASRVSLTLTEYAKRDFSLLDVTVSGCSKGTALSEWADRRGISPAEVMAVGDNLNDREMLEFAGHPVVMGNAVKELKALGWPTTGTNDEAGLAVAIRALALSSATQ